MIALWKLNKMMQESIYHLTGIIHKDSRSWLAESNPMRRVRAFKISDIVCQNHVITSQDKTTDNSCNNLDKTSEAKNIQLDNVPRAYEVANGRKVEVEGESRTPQGHFQFNNLLGTHGLDNTAFSILTFTHTKGTITLHMSGFIFNPI